MTTDCARVKILAETPVPWTTRVEINGTMVPCTSVEYKASVGKDGGLAMVTLTFPAIIDLDVALETGRIAIRQGAVRDERPDWTVSGEAVRKTLREHYAGESSKEPLILGTE